MKVTPNPFLIRFDRITEDDVRGPTAKALVAAGLETETSGEWMDHAVGGSILVADKPVEPYVSTYGTSPEVAITRATNWIEAERQRLDLLEQQIEMYGADAVTQRRRAIPASATAWKGSANPDLIHEIVGGAATHVWINGVEFQRDRGGVLKRRGGAK